METLDAVIEDVRSRLENIQKEDGHWVFNLEADVTIPAEYILLNHYLDERDAQTEEKLAVYIRRIQGDHGGWPLFHAGDFDMSATVKGYYALKMVGDDMNAPHMVKARNIILANGGAAKCNVFARIMLALFGQVPWRAVPVMPAEIMFLPRWFPFHLSKISYWSRTVIVPLLVLMALKPKAKNPKNVDVPELFVTPAEKERHYNTNPTGSLLGSFFLGLDKVLRLIEPLFPKGLRQKAIDRAVSWFTARLNGEDGLGGIFPAMANAVMAYDALGYPKDHGDYVIARKSVDKLLTADGEERFCQPCLSPIWDTGLAVHAMMESVSQETDARNDPGVAKALDWMAQRQILDVEGDWINIRPGVKPGGWAFQYWNDYYPDVDDTAVVAMALDRQGDEKYKNAIDRATEWVIGMQSKNGGWGAFDADNTQNYLNHIPFADHGALLDPPTEDVSARCVSMLAQLGFKGDHPSLARGLSYLREQQEQDGSWFGRWGTNYIYGTWSALCAFNAVGEDMSAPHIRKAVSWLVSRQRQDGGWGEDAATYWDGRRDEVKASTPSQTSWALLALMAAGEVDHPAVKRGVDYLLKAPRDGHRWHEEFFNAVGFPRIFYITYHGYAAYFPLWALARYRNLIRANAPSALCGM